MTDTIAAIATGMGGSGIGIIRISGSLAIQIADRIFIPNSKNKKVSDMRTYTAAFGHISYDGRVYDEAVCLVMRSPHSYTTEDIVELDCHGSIIVLKQIFDLVIRMGARPAEPGEFTKRAFLNGRIDMSQAESVMDLIHSKNEMAAASSLKQLSGGLRDVITDMREKLLYNIAYIESALDDPENYSLDNFPTELMSTVDKLLISVDALIKSSASGRIIREGIRTVILGRPNAGKSSVLNMLLGVDRAIVTDIEGTTRDTLEEFINIDGITLNIVDTAGIRDTEDVIERIGVDKALSIISDADLILYIVDGTAVLNANDYKIMNAVKGKKVITLINKNDMEIVVDKVLISSKIDTEILEISAKYGDGKHALHDTLKKMFFKDKISYNDELYITNQRHKALLYDAKKSLAAVKESIKNGMSEDFFTIDLMAAYESLGKIIGEALEDDLVNKIFSEFCMGK
ncbi:MAG: tRNA uridine-5-carboxymethylaminomethyl(34) synthesis GTPase MnmE [Clostridium sp.]|nr:tRNA uridine-5-carboxymethylaminomethyl(34) synthesis GTPase MnmE [Clostridium sp.]MCM1170771.1 tRNA uridine-5-carboxymethylaminomethyl(34) synthesis GTPase MnmE [Clostridium sp.]